MALLIIALTGQLAASVGGALGIGEEALSLYGLLKWPALLVVVALLVGLLYRHSPSGERTITKMARPDSRRGRRHRHVGPRLGGVRGLRQRVRHLRQHLRRARTTIAGLIWLWLTNLTLLMGDELDAALELRVGTARPAMPEPAPPATAP